MKDAPWDLGEVKFKVKSCHIKEGKPKSANYCPIALALKDKAFESVSVERSKVSVKYQNEHYFAYTPDIDTVFINKFDNGEPVKPFYGRLYFRKS